MKRLIVFALAAGLATCGAVFARSAGGEAGTSDANGRERTTLVFETTQQAAQPDGFLVVDDGPIPLPQAPVQPPHQDDECMSCAD